VNRDLVQRLDCVGSEAPSEIHEFSELLGHAAGVPGLTWLEADLITGLEASDIVSR
jgi:hypothetical protein